ncbi:MAG: hypothetical protein J5985_03275 [Kiritimatiellae bacterium]|nr:hypothetical protein [Kiritimatiellia bacterium]
MRKLASIVEIASCDPIPDTERLSVATMVGKGWRVVTGRDEFTPGDIAVYFEIDSYLPPDDARYAFLRERCLRRFVSKGGSVLREGIRIKTAKLRGVISQGLLMPVSKFPEAEGREIGTDLTSLLKVDHYDEVKEMLQPAMGNPLNAEAMGDFPSLIPKSDEERLQGLTDYFTTMKGRLFEVTAKDDGSSATIFFSPEIDTVDPFGVCSRNLRLKRPAEGEKGAAFWQVVSKDDIETKLKKHYDATKQELALQGELVGPGINADRDRYTDFEFHVFRIWDITAQRFMMPKERVAFCKQLGIPHVQVLEMDFPFFDTLATMEDALKFAEGKTARGNEREGIVMKASDGIDDTHFKVVSNRYLLKQQD